MTDTSIFSLATWHKEDDDTPSPILATKIKVGGESKDVDDTSMHRATVLDTLATIRLAVVWFSSGLGTFWLNLMSERLSVHQGEGYIKGLIVVIWDFIVGNKILLMFWSCVKNYLYIKE